jgi:hypothetical protein
VQDIAKAFGGQIELIDGDPGRAESGEAPNKARKELGWETTLDILDYIRSFVEANPLKENHKVLANNTIE